MYERASSRASGGRCRRTRFTSIGTAIATPASRRRPLRATARNGASSTSATNPPRPGLAEGLAHHEADEQEHRARPRLHEQRAEGGRDPPAARAPQERRPVVPGDRESARPPPRASARSAREGGAERALGHVEDPGDRQRRETGHPEERSPRNGAGADRAQVDAPRERWRRCSRTGCSPPRTRRTSTASAAIGAHSAVAVRASGLTGCTGTFFPSLATPTTSATGVLTRAIAVWRASAADSQTRRLPTGTHGTSR